MPRKRIKKTPTRVKIDTRQVTENLLRDTLAALESLRGLKLTRGDDGHRGLVPSFANLTRTALELVKHIEERELRNGLNPADTKPPAVINILNKEDWKKNARDAHVSKTTIGD